MNMKERIIGGDGGVTSVFVMVSCGGNFHLLLSWSVFMIILIWVYIVSSFLCKFVILELCVCVCVVFFLSFFLISLSILFSFCIIPTIFVILYFVILTQCVQSLRARSGKQQPQPADSDRYF